MIFTSGVIVWLALSGVWDAFDSRKNSVWINPVLPYIYGTYRCCSVETECIYVGDGPEEVKGLAAGTNVAHGRPELNVVNATNSSEFLSGSNSTKRLRNKFTWNVVVSLSRYGADVAATVKSDGMSWCRAKIFGFDCNGAPVENMTRSKLAFYDADVCTKLSLGCVIGMFHLRPGSFRSLPCAMGRSVRPIGSNYHDPNTESRDHELRQSVACGLFRSFRRSNRMAQVSVVLLVGFVVVLLAALAGHIETKGRKLRFALLASAMIFYIGFFGWTAYCINA